MKKRIALTPLPVSFHFISMCCSVLCSMCFSAKLLMDHILLLVLMPAILTAYAVSANKTESASTPVNFTTSMPTHESPQITHKPYIVTLPPAVGRIKVQWDDNNPCRGTIYFSINFTESKVLCSNKIINAALGKELCLERRCGDFIDFMYSTKTGYLIHDNLTATSDTHCEAASFTCKDAEKNELLAYKVMTGLLLTLIAVVLFCRYGQPVYIAVRKRFSQKRQNRWIGPTQSQSVSYHRGQASNPNNNTMKRQSYPGLDRLTVNTSREPSSNRNSDYDSYGF